ncbi:MAG: lipopolysaccharide biosynthesis protein [Mucilaginibacter sp.]|nr:lipopolysaccharide biosynthesis protein [Mucilaginibacter sp.]
MKLIAYYLPQFHPIPENDLWWGDGFTEWTNVKKAKSLYPGHYQPKIPADLGYYDLRSSETREAQAQMAKEAGVDAFCYWHYWFGNGKRLLERPFNDVLSSGKPDFPFCLGWANEAWKAKEWGGDPSKDRTLIDQTYPGDKDIVDHFYSLLPAFNDTRYLRIEGKPVFVIYKPELLPDAKKFMDAWNNLAAKEGLTSGIFFVGHTNLSSRISKILDLGFDAVNIVRLGDCKRNKFFLMKNLMAVLKHMFLKLPLKIDYESAIKLFSQHVDFNDNIFPSIIPNWDHTPRSGANGLVLHGSTPELFNKHVKSVFETIYNKPKDQQIVFIKSWNEWGEGNHMEPDTKFGKALLAVLRENVTAFNKASSE